MNALSVLAGHLREMILPLPMMDLKYRETIPQIVGGFPIGALSDEENVLLLDSLSKKKKKKTTGPKKTKPGKNGLYPDEDIYVMKWWLNRRSQADQQEITEMETRKQTIIWEQRARETKLQIILILEILALESVLKVDGSHAASSDKLDLPVEEPGPKSKKPRKPQDLSVLLELLADRICIWQSTNQSPRKDPAKHKKIANAEGTAGPKLATSDHLRQFGADVVLPL